MRLLISILLLQMLSQFSYGQGGDKEKKAGSERIRTAIF